MERAILTTGGTGGHIFPALAVADELRRRYPGIRVLFAGSQYGPEGALAEKAGLEFAGLPVRGFLGRGVRALSAGPRVGPGDGADPAVPPSGRGGIRRLCRIRAGAGGVSLRHSDGGARTKCRRGSQQ